MTANEQFYKDGLKVYGSKCYSPKLFSEKKKSFFFCREEGHYRTLIRCLFLNHYASSVQL